MHPPPLSSRHASCVCFLGRVFQAVSMFGVFLSRSSSLPLSRSPTSFGLGLFLGFLSFDYWGSRFSLPLVVFRVSLCCLCSVLLHGFFWIEWFRSPSSSVGFRRLLLFVGLLWVGRPVLCLFSVFLFWSVLGGAALRVFLLSRLLVNSQLALSFCRCVPWTSLYCW